MACSAGRSSDGSSVIGTDASCHSSGTPPSDKNCQHIHSPSAKGRPSFLPFSQHIPRGGDHQRGVLEGNQEGGAGAVNASSIRNVRAVLGRGNAFLIGPLLPPCRLPTSNQGLPLGSPVPLAEKSSGNLAEISAQMKTAARISVSARSSTEPPPSAPTP